MFDLDYFIRLSLEEDIGPGDFTSIACIPENAIGKAKLLVKDNGIAAGVELAKRIFNIVDPSLKVEVLINDGKAIYNGDVLLIVEGPSRSIVTAERLVLNCAQRMSGIATLTSLYVKEIADLNTKLLDTRKTTPLFRQLEKWAVRIGGGFNHRFGLFDMMMIKDNHIDYAGGIRNAILKARDFSLKNNLELKIEIETRNLSEVKEVLDVGRIDRIMLDNFTITDLAEAVKLVNGTIETEASGGITIQSIRSYALTGVDYISCGAITHSAPNLDLSLKAIS